MITHSIWVDGTYLIPLIGEACQRCRNFRHRWPLAIDHTKILIPVILTFAGILTTDISILYILTCFPCEWIFQQLIYKKNTLFYFYCFWSYSQQWWSSGGWMSTSWRSPRASSSSCWARWGLWTRSSSRPPSPHWPSPATSSSATSSPELWAHPKPYTSSPEPWAHPKT